MFKLIILPNKKSQTHTRLPKDDALHSNQIKKYVSLARPHSPSAKILNNIHLTYQVLTIDHATHVRSLRKYQLKIQWMPPYKNVTPTIIILYLQENIQ